MFSVDFQVRLIKLIIIGKLRDQLKHTDMTMWGRNGHQLLNFAKGIKFH